MDEDNVFSLNRIGDVLLALRTAKIIHVDNSRKGTQLKLSVKLEVRILKLYILLLYFFLH